VSLNTGTRPDRWCGAIPVGICGDDCCVFAVFEQLPAAGYGQPGSAFNGCVVAGIRLAAVAVAAA